MEITGRRLTSSTAVAARLLAALGAFIIAIAACPAANARASQGRAHTASQRVALIPGPGPVPRQGPNGIMPTSSYVSGRPSEDFSRFSFASLSYAQITPANLAGFDTVALIQVPNSNLSSSEKTALAQFVASGGKLLIHDSDETRGNDYSWLLGGPYTTGIGQGCNDCGSSSGSSSIVSNSSIISADPSAPSYVDIAQLWQFTDQGDANLLVSTDPRWLALAQGTNGQGEMGAQVAYAHSGSGVVIYNGFDTDFIRANASDPWRCNDPTTGFACPPPPAPQPTVDWLAQMWYSELASGWSASGSPSGTPVAAIGTTIAPDAAGLPPNSACVAHRRLTLHLKRLAHMRHRTIVQVDVYVSGRHVLRERRPLKNRTISHMPSHGTFTVKIIATTNRRYHLISKQHYRAC